MEIITVSKENIEQEHICCAISNNNDCQVASKKAWLSARFGDGLVFKKGNVRGKCFIEYIPAENAWIPIEADNYMYIDCFWVSGQFKGQGLSNLLFDSCVADCKEKGKQGLVVLSSEKKMPFLSDPKYLQHKGFLLADKTGPFCLMYLPFDKTAQQPKFKDSVKNPQPDCDGFVLYYTNQCPFTAKYVPILNSLATSKNVKLKTIHIETKEQARNAPTPFTSFSLFYNGNFITHEILSEKKFEKIIEGNLS